MKFNIVVVLCCQVSLTGVMGARESVHSGVQSLLKDLKQVIFILNPKPETLSSDISNCDH